MVKTNTLNFKQPAVKCLQLLSVCVCERKKGGRERERKLLGNSYSSMPLDEQTAVVILPRKIKRGRNGKLLL